MPQTRALLSSRLGAAPQCGVRLGALRL